MHRSDFIFETIEAVGLSSSTYSQPNIHDWLAQTISKLSQQARSTNTTCRPSQRTGYYHVTHGQTTHHLTAYEAYRFLQSILWLYDINEAES